MIAQRRESFTIEGRDRMDEHKVKGPGRDDKYMRRFAERISAQRKRLANLSGVRQYANIHM